MSNRYWRCEAVSAQQLDSRCHFSGEEALQSVRSGSRLGNPYTQVLRGRVHLLTVFIDLNPTLTRTRSGQLGRVHRSHLGMAMSTL